MINVAPAAAGFLFQPAARRDIDLAADDGFDAFFARRLVKINDAVHRAVVGDGERGEFQFMGLVHQPVQPAGAIEQRILGVQMEMNKVRVRHGTKLLHLVGAEQAGAARGQIKATSRYDKNVADRLAQHPSR